MKSELVDLTLHKFAETEKAVLVALDDQSRSSAVWLPKSQIEIEERRRPGQRPAFAVTMPERLALEKGLI